MLTLNTTDAVGPEADAGRFNERDEHLPVMNLCATKREKNNYSASRTSPLTVFLSWTVAPKNGHV